MNLRGEMSGDPDTVQLHGGFATLARASNDRSCVK